jgi:hypothetical protein
VNLGVSGTGTPVAAKGVACAVLVLFAQGVRAEEWPAFRAGTWDFNRSIQTAGSAAAPQVVNSSRCVNPSEDMQRQNQMLSKAGCSFSPLTRSGNVYTFAADCRIQGIAGKSKSTITVESDSAYTIRVESTLGPQPTTELLRARRTGDCGK